MAAVAVMMLGRPAPINEPGAIRFQLYPAVGESINPQNTPAIAISRNGLLVARTVEPHRRIRRNICEGSVRGERDRKLASAFLP